MVQRPHSRDVFSIFLKAGCGQCPMRREQPRARGALRGASSTRQFRHQAGNLGLGREAAGPGPRIANLSIDLDIELPGCTGAQFDVGDAQFVQGISHPESLGLVPSPATIMDDDLHHAPLRGVFGACCVPWPHFSPRLSPWISPWLGPWRASASHRLLREIGRASCRERV